MTGTAYKNNSDLFTALPGIHLASDMRDAAQAFKELQQYEDLNNTTNRFRLLDFQAEPQHLQSSNQRPPSTQE